MKIYNYYSKIITIFLFYYSSIFYHSKIYAKNREYYKDKSKTRLVNIFNNKKNIEYQKQKYKKNNLQIIYTKYKIKFYSIIEAKKILKEAKSYLGTPYISGGNSKLGIDCSSFIYNIFNQVYNIILPKLSYKQAKKGNIISINNLKIGDLLFFSTKITQKKINHVGIIIAIKNKDILFIHASSSNGVIISNIRDQYWRIRFILARRIYYNYNIFIKKNKLFIIY